MTPGARNRFILAVALLVAAGALAFIAFGDIGKNLVYYWSPSEMLAQGERAFGPTIRLGGVVQPGSVEWSAQKTSVKFRVADSHKSESASVVVHCEQTPPQMFREGIGVVVEGTLDKSQVFKSKRLMVNHSNEYRPPKEGEKPADWKGSVSEAAEQK
ncbi:MAG: cytochrome c maturation protein CcmE [Myxococcales bacterium]|nr:cytochrome c maturation protein CcmE [Myxococcales bacterium]